MHGVSEKAAGGPAAVYWMTEPARGLVDLASLPVAARWLATAPRGDGHGVLVFPGFLSSDVSTRTLRRFLSRLGYQVRGWNLGRNLGPTDRVVDELPRAISALAEVTGKPVSLVGWSLGGIYARELARRNPAPIRQVITLGSPFAIINPKQSRVDSFYRRRAHLHADAVRLPSPEEIARPIEVPSTAVYSRRDGIVAWQTCTEPASELHDNVEVRCSHLGFGVDPATLWIVADRLALPPGPQPRFEVPARQRFLYPRRV
ncbi:MAG TPA: alpha/beta fold hydrolase [Streptosporangiaceae bacterium]|nr:alpha/beta fold hydrolase [Streptosporangiaceae bacterium]